MRWNPVLISGRWSRWLLYVVALSVSWPLLMKAVNSASPDNGFDLSNSLLPVEQIFHGGPPRDGIPALTNPRFIPSAEADFLSPDARVMGIERNGERRAYPIRILNYHEIVNDRVGGEGVVISYCPLCGTGMVFSATVAGKARQFGVSGLLYNSDVLLYDRGSESLWSQIMGQAISGPLAGTRLHSIPVHHTTWELWQEEGPSTVLSLDTGYKRDYSSSPYGNYDSSEAIYFPVSARSRQYHPKERVLGIELGGEVKAYPFAELAQRKSPLHDTIAGKEVVIHFDAVARSGRIFDATGKELSSLNAFWFAWFTFHPQTAIFKAGR
ncbi:MAG: DUF3179 domain-containing protein [Pseudomonadota bacterium]